MHAIWATVTEDSKLNLSHTRHQTQHICLELDSPTNVRKVRRTLREGPPEYQHYQDEQLFGRSCTATNFEETVAAALYCSCCLPQLRVLYSKSFATSPQALIRKNISHHALRILFMLTNQNTRKLEETALTEKELYIWLNIAVNSILLTQKSKPCRIAVKVARLGHIPAQILNNIKSAIPSIIKNIKGSWKMSRASNSKLALASACCCEVAPWMIRRKGGGMCLPQLLVK
ncbi:hypothetical protein BDQ17DRAFT_1332002 [Cyathus striatus]|nr:hypothetical protein BDQ17DRAFT_1332002 [Cyathus striatus]